MNLFNDMTVHSISENNFGGQKKWANDSERVAFLIRRYEALTSLLAGR
jgi:hypothetical protein